MKRWALLLVMACAGCDGCAEGNSIQACGYACRDADAKMAKWSKTEGCVCDATTGAKPQ